MKKRKELRIGIAVKELAFQNEKRKKSRIGIKIKELAK
jgi:hypothetical protein